jgi:enterochelin esterase-like enzyme
MCGRYASIEFGLLLVLMLQSCSSQEGTLECGEITSPALEGNLIGDPATRPFAVYLPPGYEASQKRYPAFYVLHGGGGSAESMTDMRSTLDRMIGNGEIGEMIGVFVDTTTRFGGIGFWSSVTIGDYETYITKDLVNHVDAHYRTIPQPDSRGITGISAGACGAMHLAIKFPNVFGVLVAQGGHYDWDTDWHKAWAVETAVMEDWTDYRGWGSAVLSKAAFAAPNPDRPPFFLDKPYELVDGKPRLVPEVWEKIVNHDLMHDLDRYHNQPVRLNGIKIVHGRADNVVPILQARELDKKLTDLGIDHAYIEHEGGHEFVPEESLQFLSGHLAEI